MMRRLVQGALVGAVCAVVVMVIWLSGLLQDFRLRLNDSYFISAPTQNNIVIVALDDASFAAYGRSLLDWPRTVYADAVRNISDGGARVIAFDVLFAQSTADDTAVADALRAARQSAQRTRIVMPVIGTGASFRNETVGVRYNETLFPVEQFVSAADYLGYVNVLFDQDDIVRRQLSLVQRGNDMTLSLPLAAYFAYLRVPSSAAPQLLTHNDGVLTFGDTLTIPIMDNGEWRQNYYGANAFPIISFQDVVNGRYNAGQFNDKLVLIGLANAVGAVDVYPTPQGLQAGVVVLANAIETLQQNQVPREPARAVQVALIVGLALLCGVIYTQLRPLWMIGAAALLLVAWVVGCFVYFGLTYTVINLFDTSLAIALPILGSLVSETLAEAARRRNAEFMLASLYKVSEQRLSLARILPNIAQNLRQITRATYGSIWLYEVVDDSQPQLRLGYHWGDGDTTAQALTVPQQPLVQDGQLLIPIQWQNRVLGMFQLEARTVSHDEQRQLSAYTERVAPSLENAMLYTLTQQQNELTQKIFEASPSGLAVLGDDLVLRRANAALHHTVGITARHLLPPPPVANTNDAAQSPAPELPPPTPEVQALYEAFGQRRRFRKEWQIGKQTYQIDATPFGDKEWVVAVTDVSPLAELSTLKTRMIRMASHDLKNPLGRVMGYGELIMDSTDEEMPPAQMRKFVKEMVGGSEHMLQIINDILNLEQLRSGRGLFEAFDLAELVKTVSVPHQADARNKRQTFNIEIAEGLPKVNGDRRLLSQALTNLIGNAVKYTPDGGTITVRLLPHKTSTASDGVRLEVQDTGYGISEAAQAKLFQEFYRVRTAETAHIPGTGLGLSLVKSIIENHNGTLGVTSREKVGSTFYVELPPAR
jgi:signal transduction histidine kinase/CHASE2 domain-containing sensor protein